MKDFIFSLSKEAFYPEPPFHPPQVYQELSPYFNEVSQDNFIYRKIRNLFIQYGFDKENIGKARWNPFRGMISDGQTVVIKPNLVFEEQEKNIGKKAIMTHASIIRPIIDYLYILQKTDNIDFKIIIGDVPIQCANFKQILKDTSLDVLIDYFRNKIQFNNLEILDLRDEIAITTDTNFFTIKKVNNDPLGYSSVHLKKSFLDDIVKDFHKFGAPGYETKQTIAKHKGVGHHYYHIANTILAADLFINIPKIKTHKKAGITIALKNLIGINGDKSWVPHFRRGAKKYGGDEFDNSQLFLKYLITRSLLFLQGRYKPLWDFARMIYRKSIKKYLIQETEETQNHSSKQFLINGDWHGNDTIWRPVLDLNFLLFFTNKKGEVTSSKQRKYLCIADGIISGEGNGPLDPEPKKTGLLTISQNPIIHDICCARLMGFDWQKIPKLKNSVKLQEYLDFDGSTENIYIYGAIKNDAFVKFKYNDLPNLSFLPSKGWINHIEI